MRNWKDTEFTKFIRLKNSKLEILKKIKGKKSSAGKLDEIIEFYLESKSLKKLIINKERDTL